MKIKILVLAICIVRLGPLVAAQEQGPSTAAQEAGPAGKGIDYLLKALLSMASPEQIGLRGCQYATVPAADHWSRGHLLMITHWNSLQSRSKRWLCQTEFLT